MSILLIRIFLLATIGFLAGSVLSVIFSGSIVFPTFVFAFAIAFALSRGFLDALPAVIALGLFADVATLGRVGMLSGFSVGLAYTASFFSRRFVVEHSALTAVFSGSLAGFSAILFPVFSDGLLYGSVAALDRLSDVLSVRLPVISVVSGVVFFALAVVAIRKHDELVSRMDPGSTFFVRRQKR